MRIGILTFHRAHNYGAVLQAYALQEFLRSYGHEAIIIDYRQPYIEKIYKCFSLKRCFSKNPLLILIKIARELKQYNSRKIKKEKFEAFNYSFLHLSQPVINSGEIPCDYDVYIHGSDQIWNPKLLGGYDFVYFGMYKTAIKSIKLSYAASMEMKHFSLTDTQALCKGLANLSYISVREKKLIEFLAPFTNKLVVNTIDPTLLASSDIWSVMCKKSITSMPYILIYQVGKGTSVKEQAILFSKKIGLKVLSVNQMNLSPEEFVCYIRYAKCIISDSFHATVFALLFNKDFYTMATGTGSDIRFTGLLEELQLESRIVREPISQYNSINYSQMNIREKLEQHRSFSKEFLLKILSNESV